MLAHLERWIGLVFGGVGIFQTRLDGTEQNSDRAPVPPCAVLEAKTRSPFWNLEDWSRLSRTIPDRSSPGVYGSGGRT